MSTSTAPNTLNSIPFHKQLSESVAYIQQHYAHPIDALVILGSGLGEFAGSLQEATAIAYQDIPHFCKPTVDGHAGNFVFGTILQDSGKKLHVACMQGRFHTYEGHCQKTVSFPVRVAQALGAKTLLVTNSAGGINLTYKPGTLMLISDHINFTANNPLIGPNPLDEKNAPFGPRFLDMTNTYDEDYREQLRQIAIEEKIPLAEGVYLGLCGPSYETPAEIRMFRTLGADAVGMSTVPEVIVARHVGLRVLGISCITNAAAGITGEALSHQEVTETANSVKSQFMKLLDRFLKTVPLH